MESFEGFDTKVSEQGFADDALIFPDVSEANIVPYVATELAPIGEGGDSFHALMEQAEVDDVTDVSFRETLNSEIPPGKVVDAPMLEAKRLESEGYLAVPVTPEGAECITVNGQLYCRMPTASAVMFSSLVSPAVFEQDISSSGEEGLLASGEVATDEETFPDVSDELLLENEPTEIIDVDPTEPLGIENDVVPLITYDAPPSVE